MRIYLYSDLYDSHIRCLSHERKVALEKKLIFGYLGFGFVFGLLQYTGVGDLTVAVWFSRAVALLVPSMQVIEFASEEPNCIRFFYAVMWVIAFGMAWVQVPLSIELNREALPEKIRKRPWLSMIIIPFLLLCLYVIYLYSGDPKSLGAWKMYGNIANMSFYGTPVMAWVNCSVTLLGLLLPNWRQIYFFWFK